MGKKGFTLVELISIVVILAIILAVAVPSITGVIQSAKERACILDAKMLERAAKNYVQTTGLTINNGDNQILSLAFLKENGYISEVLDPNDRITSCQGYVVVSNNGNYSYDAELKCSNTCQTANYVDDTVDEPSFTDDMVEKNGDWYFEGSNPNNWVRFGLTEGINNRGIMWRIVKMDKYGIKMVYEGLENGALQPLEDGRVLIDGTMGIAWNINGTNKWNEPASLVGKLDDWLSHLNISNISKYCTKANWKVGGVPYYDPTIIGTFVQYQGIDSTNTGGTFSGLTNYQSYVGTINAVDFMYTSDNEICSKSYRETGSTNECAYNTDGALNNFMQKDKYHYWTLNARSDTSNLAWNISNSGLIGSNLVSLATVSVRPVLN